MGRFVPHPPFSPQVIIAVETRQIFLWKMLSAHLVFTLRDLVILQYKTKVSFSSVGNMKISKKIIYRFWQFDIFSLLHFWNKGSKVRCLVKTNLWRTKRLSRKKLAKKLTRIKKKSTSFALFLWNLFMRV